MSKPEGKISRKDQCYLVAIVRDEERYLDEWLRYHRHLGFDGVLLYDNSEAFTLENLPARYPGFVRVIQFPGAAQQVAAYNAAANLLKAEKTCRWLALIDIDEFIVLRKHAAIRDLLEAHCQDGALALNWVMFASSGELHYRAKPVLKRFQRRQIGVNRHIKCIVHLPSLIACEVHHVHLKKGVIHDCDGRTIEGAFHPDGNDHTAAIFHYFTKSREEFLEKMKRGRADTGAIRELKIFDKTEGYANAFIDRTAWQFLRSRESWWGSLQRFLEGRADSR